MSSNPIQELADHLVARHGVASTVAHTKVFGRLSIMHRDAHANPCAPCGGTGKVRCGTCGGTGVGPGGAPDHEHGDAS